MRRFARLDASAQGQIVALAVNGYKPVQIREEFKKTGGKHPRTKTVRDCVERVREDPDWRGDHPGCPGQDWLIDTKLQKRIQNSVFKERGSAVVTTKLLKKRIAALRHMNLREVQGVKVRGPLPVSFSLLTSLRLVCA